MVKKQIAETALACKIDMNKQVLVGFISALLKILVKRSSVANSTQFYEEPKKLNRFEEIN